MIQNIVLPRGDTKIVALTLRQGGLPLDLTSASVTMTVDGLFTKTDTDGIEVAAPQSGGGLGDITVTIDPADTGDVPNWRSVYRYDIQVTDSGEVTTPIRGRLIVLPDVTE